MCFASSLAGKVAKQRARKKMIFLKYRRFTRCQTFETFSEDFSTTFELWQMFHHVEKAL